MSDSPTTGRAQRQQAVASGERATGIDRVDTPDPGTGLVEGTSRSRQLDTQREIAAQTDTDPSGVATTATRGGMDAFLRSSGARDFAASLRDQFASSADFVREGDVAANVDPQDISAAPVVAPGQRDDVAARARQQTAADAQFIEAGDLAAEVGARGVTDLGIPEGRRDDVAQRARRGLASEDEYADPEDFSADVSATGIESAGLTDAGAERRAAAQFTAETALDTATPADVTPAEGGGFALDTAAQERVAARQFEDDIGLFGQGELDTGDVRETDSGFGLAEAPSRELAAAELSEQVDGEVAPGDVTLEERDNGGFKAIFGGGN